MKLAPKPLTCSIASVLQQASPGYFQHLAIRWLAGWCCLLVVLAGTLAANPAWHEAWHHHAEKAGTEAGHHDDSESAGHENEASCAICAFAHQQVAAGGLGSIAVIVLDRYGVAEWMTPAVVAWESVWPEPSGRGPPQGV